MPRTVFTTGPNTPATATDGGGAKTWSNVNNAKVEDGNLAQCLNIGPGGGGGVPNQMNLTALGFALPGNAVIDGIKLEAKVSGPANDALGGAGGVYLLYNGGATSYANTPNAGNSWPASLTWITYGGATSLWGRTWTPAEINHANFGASLSASLGSGTGNIAIDSARITVYWHYSNDVAAADVPKRYLYKVFNKGAYLGNLPKVESKFGYPLDINSAGSSISIVCGVSADTSALPGDRLVTELGEPITTELGEYIYTEGQSSLFGPGNSVDPYIIQNGNHIEVWEYSYYYPNGKLMFQGQVNRIEAGFGSSADNKLKLLVLSDGLDLDNYIARGAPFNYTDDVVQNVVTNQVFAQQSGDKGAGWTRYGQTWIVGAGVTKLGAIKLLLTGQADVTVTVYDNVGGNVLGSVTQFVDAVGVQSTITFAFASLIDVAPGGTYFFTVSVDGGQIITVYYDISSPYANGKFYESIYGGGSGGGSYSEIPGDMTFSTAAGLPTTTATYTSKDPTTEMFKPIIDDYRIRGGQLRYTSTSVDATGLSLTALFNTETIFDAMRKVLSLSPNGFYFYVDPGTNIITFKRVLTTPTWKFIKGRHINKLNQVMSIENVKNDLLFSGAETAGTNLYTEYENQASQTNYGKRLERKSDNRVSIQATADAIGDSFIQENAGEYYETTITILDRTMDITLLKPGQTVGLRGFGNFIDNQIMQIVRLEYTPEAVNMTLGNMPKRFSAEFENTIRGLLAQQTVGNPSAPS